MLCYAATHASNPIYIPTRLLWVGTASRRVLCHHVVSFISQEKKRKEAGGGVAQSVPFFFFFHLFSVTSKWMTYMRRGAVRSGARWASTRIWCLPVRARACRVCVCVAFKTGRHNNTIVYYSTPRLRSHMANELFFLLGRDEISWTKKSASFFYRILQSSFHPPRMRQPPADSLVFDSFWLKCLELSRARKRVDDERHPKNLAF